MINVEEVKKKILGFLNEKGPGLPIHISRAIDLSPVFSSAILSELVNERRVAMSNLRVGSSSLYMIPGDVARLEDFIDNLTGIDKTMFLRLKNEKIIDDEKQSPAERVALRGIKDFAFAVKFDGKLFWKFFSVSNEEAENILTGKKKNVEVENSFPVEKRGFDKKEIEEQKDKNIFAPAGVPESAHGSRSPAEQKLKIEKPILEIKQKIKKERRIPEEFLREVKDFLIKNDIEYLNDISLDKKQISARIRINSDVGKICFFLVARDKKKPNIADLTLAYQEALTNKMPCYFLSRGEFSKICQEFLRSHENLMKFGVL